MSDLLFTHDYGGVRATDAARNRDDAIQQVSDHAQPDWKEMARRALLRTCKRLDTFIVDDIWVDLRRLGVEPRDDTHERRAMGAVVVQAAREGLIEKTGEYRASNQPQCHGNPRVVWRAKR